MVRILIAIAPLRLLQARAPLIGIAVRVGVELQRPGVRLARVDQQHIRAKHLQDARVGHHALRHHARQPALRIRQPQVRRQPLMAQTVDQAGGAAAEIDRDAVRLLVVERPEDPLPGGRGRTHRRYSSVAWPVRHVEARGTMRLAIYRLLYHNSHASGIGRVAAVGSTMSWCVGVACWWWAVLLGTLWLAPWRLSGSFRWPGSTQRPKASR